MADTPPLTLKSALHGRTAEITVHGDLDLTTAPKLAEMLNLMLDKRPASLVLDLDRVKYLDCAAARVIAQAAHTLPTGHQLTIRNPAPIVRRLLRLTGVHETVTITGGKNQPGPAPLTVTVARDGRICLLTSPATWT
jgi:anti-sigma B factor antagonist